MRGGLTWLTALAVFFLVGCTSRIHVPYKPGPEATPVSRERLPPVYPYRPEPVAVTNRVLTRQETDLYRVRRLRIPSAGDNGQPDDLVHALYYQSKLPGKKRLVIVLPIWGSYAYPSEKITAGVRDRSDGGTNVLRVLGENYVLEWETLGEAPTEQAFVEMLGRMLERERIITIDMSRIVDWAETQPDIDASRIGIVGFSHSALTAALVAVNEPRMAAIVLVMGTGRPHLLMTTCPGRAARLKEKIQSRFGWSNQKYLNTMEALFAPYDPARYPGRADPRRVLFIDAHDDDCMPQEGRDALWEAFGRPERISVGYTHKRAFLAMTPLGFNWLRYRIYDFLDETLDAPTPPQPNLQSASN
jgi:dienelactone hydrolase